MKIVRPYARIVDAEAAANALLFIESAARVSHRSEDEAGLKTEKFIRAVVLQRGDWSVVEHVSVSVEMVVDRGITHELVRHRIASYTQESTRFVNYAKKIPPAFIYPKPDVFCSHCDAGNHPQPGEGRAYGYDHTKPWFHAFTLGDAIQCPYEPVWLCAIEGSEGEYRNLLDLGWRPQEARSVFPNALASKIIVTMNLRSWRHFFLMRTTKEAHPQMRQVTIPLLAEFKQLIPVLYEDIEPEARQVENIAKGR